MLLACSPFVFLEDGFQILEDQSQLLSPRPVQAVQLSSRGMRMFQELSPEILQTGQSILKFLGATTVSGFLGLWGAWIAFPPELVIEAVSDKSKKFNLESRLKIKNIGKLRAFDVHCNAENLTFLAGAICVKNCSVADNGDQYIPRLSGGESAEASVTPGVNFSSATQATEFSYTLLLKYHARMIGLRKTFEKKWKVELRTFEDGYSWNVTPIS